MSAVRTFVGVWLLSLVFLGVPVWRHSSAASPQQGQTSQASPTSPDARSFAAPGSFIWMINGHALALLQRQADRRVVEAYFDNPHTYVMVTAGGLAAVPPKSVPTVTFTSYANMQSTLRAGRLDPRYRAVVYDSEDWPFTPPEEQRDPGRYYALAAALAHEHHLTFIATPATNLARSVRSRTAGTRFDAFIDLRIAAAAAGGADLYEIQAQGAEANLSLFTAFVSRAASQARSANPAVLVLAGLSTNPTGHTVSADQLLGAVESTHDIVNGYWLNIPGQSEYCPSCGTPRADVAAEFLKKLQERAGRSSPGGAR